MATKLKCACVRDDAHECYRARYPRSFDDIDAADDYGERCECPCHDVEPFDYEEATDG